MNPRKNPDPDELRLRAEERLMNATPPRDAMRDPSQLNRIIHELQVHQIELEMQNEELFRSRAQQEWLKDRYFEFYDFSPAGFVSLDRDGKILQINLTGAFLLGRERSQLVGQRFDTFVVMADRPAFITLLNQVFTFKAKQSWDVELVQKDQPPRTVHVEATYSPEHEECRVVLVDLTARNLAEADLRLLTAEYHQSQKMESLGSLAGGVAHDMNNVLGAILGMASMLRERIEPEDPEAKPLDTIVNACLRGRGVVKSLLYFAHKPLQEDRTFKLNALAREMARLLSHTTLQRVEVALDLQEDLGLVHGDEGALSHALMNLCVNAMDAMSTGGTLLLQTRARADGGVELRVKDTGEGMTPQVLVRAKEPFFTTKGPGKGSGLGLSMVYSTMQAHEGTFDLHSQAGLGTEAVLGFPPARVARAAPSPKAQPLTSETPLPALDVLLVDDDELFRESMTAILQCLGHRAVAVPGGLEAIQLLEQDLPADLVILDMNMPRRSGAQALPRILALRPGLPVLLCSGYTDEDMTPLLLGRPHVQSLKKPFTKGELQAKLAGMSFDTRST